MAEIIRMPKLSDTMTEGVVAEWHQKIGDEVESGELLAEIETDKATMEFESFQDGVFFTLVWRKEAPHRWTACFASWAKKARTSPICSRLQRRKPLPRKLQLLRHLLQHQHHRQRHRQQLHPLRPLRQRLLQQHRPHRLPPPPWRMVG